MHAIGDVAFHRMLFKTTSFKLVYVGKLLEGLGGREEWLQEVNNVLFLKKFTMIACIIGALQMIRDFSKVGLWY